MQDRRDNIMEEVHDLFVYSSEKEREDIRYFIEEVLRKDQTMKGYLEIFHNDMFGCQHRPFRNWLTKKYSKSTINCDEYDDTQSYEKLLPKLSENQIETNKMISSLDKEVFFNG